MPSCLLRAIGIIVVALSAISATFPAQALVCPESPNRVKPQVQATVTRDPLTQLYTYRYTVTNAPDSILSIWDFIVDIVGTVSEVANPENWFDNLIQGVNFDETHPLDAMGWDTTETIPIPADYVDTGGLLPPLYPIKPGETLGGFSFKSPKPPGPVKFYALGFMDLPSAASEEEAEEMSQECPRTAVGTLFETAYQGTTQGPVDFLPVTINIKQKSLNPKSQGVIPVAILSTADFDASTVNPLSVRFGPGQAPEIHNRGHGEDANGDGKNDLVLHFDTQASGIKCGDTSATLTGSTYFGQGIQGADIFVTVGCK